MATLQEQQAPIDQAIVNAMIESTPEDWTDIVLTLIRRGPALGEFAFELLSPQGYPPVMPVDSLYSLGRQLDEVTQRHGGVIVKATYSAKCVDERWTFEARFEHRHRD